MKSYANFILMENLLYNVPSEQVSLKILSEQLFNPRVTIVEERCGTLLGTGFDPVFLSTVQKPDRNGRVLTPYAFTVPVAPLSVTPSPFTPAQIQGLVGRNVRKVYVYHASSCISEGGVCSVCAYASRLLSTAKVVTPTETIAYFRDPPATFDQLKPAVGSSIQLQAGIGRSKEFISPSQKALFSWVANTYSGSLLGIRSFGNFLLPIKSQLYRSSINDNFLAQAYSDLTRMNLVPADILAFIDSIDDKMEKAIMIVLSYAVYGPQQTAAIVDAPDIVIS